MTTEGLRERNKQEKLRRIREAAWALFAEHGYEATTTRAIAERAGIGTGTLFLYARDKSELLFLLFRDELGRLATQGLTTIPAGAPALDGLVHVFRGFYLRYARVPELARRFVREILSLEGERKASYDALNEGFLLGLAAVLEDAKARGELRAELPTRLFAQNLFAVYGLQVLGWLEAPSPKAARGLRALREAFALLLDGARPAARRPARRR